MNAEVRDSPRPYRHSGVTPLFLPVADVLLLAAVVVVIQVLYSARELDRQADQDAQIRLAGALQKIDSQMAENVVEFTWWDEAVKRIVILLDQEWAANLWASYQVTFRNMDWVVALGADNSVLLETTRLGTIFEPAPIEIGDALALLMERSHDGSVANALPETG